jgi:hypothetical protein
MPWTEIVGLERFPLFPLFPLFQDWLQNKPKSQIPNGKNKTSCSSCQKDLDTMKAHFVNFNFSSTIEDGMLLPSSHKWKHLVMDLVFLFLPRLPNPTFVDIVLFNILVWYVLSIFSNKDTFLDKLFCMLHRGNMYIGWKKWCPCRIIGITIFLEIQLL